MSCSAPDPGSREENRGGPVAADSFRWPHAVASDGAGGCGSPTPATTASSAGTSTRQDGPRTGCSVNRTSPRAKSFPYVPQERRFRFPYGLTGVDGDLAIADTANNRVLLQPAPEWLPVGALDPTLSLGQPDLTANGENRWDAVGPDTMCWPYGLHWHRGTRELLAVADSGNNRVVLWERR